MVRKKKFNRFSDFDIDCNQKLPVQLTLHILLAYSATSLIWLMAKTGTNAASITLRFSPCRQNILVALKYSPGYPHKELDLQTSQKL